MKKILYSVVIIGIIIALTTAIIAYGRGYRLNPFEKSINSTGILSANSSPDGASIFIDGKLISATNGSISLAPNWYNLRIAKEGYQAWEKKIRIQGEVVIRVDAFLISNNPSLRSLTVSGLISPSLSPSGTRVAYIVPVEEATTSAVTKPHIGIWTYEFKNSPLGGLIDPKQVFVPLGKIDWYNSYVIWSPDEKQIALITKATGTKSEKIVSAIEIFLDNPNTPPIPITSTLESVLADWDNLKTQKQDQLLSALPQVLSDFLKNSTSNIQFAPDNNKILYLATSSASLNSILAPSIIGTNSTPEARNVEKGKFYVYDIKEDKNFFVSDQKSFIGLPRWYSDSKRIVMVENASIGVIDYDGTNKRTVYSGPFQENIVYPWTSSGKLVILTNLNKHKALPNLYEVDIR